MPMASDNAKSGWARFAATLSRSPYVRAAAACTVVSLLTSSTQPSAAALSAGPGTLWVAQEGSVVAMGGSGTGLKALGSVTSYGAMATGDSAPGALVSRSMDGPDGLAFDSSGDLWVANSTSDTVVEVPRGQLGKPGPVPGIVISSASGRALSSPSGLAFDSSGDLWVSNEASNTVTELNKQELSSSGPKSPETTIPGPSGSTVPEPLGLTFDTRGDLWMTSSDMGGFNILVEFTKGQLAGDNPRPHVTITSDAAGSLRSPGAPAVSASGAVWVPNEANNTVVEFTKPELARSGSPVPQVTISANGSATNVNEPSGLAFDAAGDLWVVNGGNDTIVEFSRTELSTSGSPAPVRTIAGPRTALNYPAAIAIER